MQQWANISGLRRAVAALSGNRSLFTAHLRVKDISHLNFKALHGVGIRAVVFDKDNTLTAPYKTPFYSPAIAASLRACQAVFGNSHVFMYSNTAGSREDRDHRLAAAIEQQLQLNVWRHRENKPNGAEAFALQCTTTLGIQRHELAIIGDRYSTDILFGNLAGLLTIKTEILTPHGENYVVRTVACSLVRPASLVPSRSLIHSVC